MKITLLDTNSLKSPTLSSTHVSLKTPTLSSTETGENHTLVVLA